MGASALRERLPWGLIGMLILIGAVERTVSRAELALTGNPTFLAWRTAERSAGPEATRAEVLCFGDSLVKLGVLPRIIEAETGRSSYNLATDSSPAPAPYFLLRRALDAGARPRALVVDYYSQVLQAHLHYSLPYWPELVGAREAVELGWTARDPNFVAETVLALALPTLKHRQAIRDAVGIALRGGDNRPMEHLLGAHLRNWRLNGGATVYHKMGPTPGPPGQREPQGQWKPYKPNIHYVRAFLDLAASRNIPVFWLLPPLTPDRQHRHEREGQDERFTRLVRELQETYPNLHVIDGRRAGYPREVFVDPTHLDRDGAAEFSAAVARLIGPVLAGAPSDSRWRDLPAYTGRRSAIPLEDLGQSMLALDPTPAATRR
jgi:hypothetical protein